MGIKECSLSDENYERWPVKPKNPRTHEECDDCALQNTEPQQCPGHPAGPVSCKYFEKAGEV